MKTFWKTSIIGLLVLALLAPLCACGVPNEPDESVTSQPESEKATTATAVEDTTPGVDTEDTQPEPEAESEGADTTEATVEDTTTAVMEGETTDDADVWDGKKATSIEVGRGTAAEPYEIYTCGELAFLVNAFNTGRIPVGVCVSLQNDLDLNGYEWRPLGTWDRPFAGVFNGNGHTIYNLNFTRTQDHTFATSGNTVGATGLFGVCSDVTICNVNISGATVRVRGNTLTGSYVGVLIGQAEVDSYLEISDVKIDNATVQTSLDVSYGNQYCGGIAGRISVGQSGEAHLCRVQAEIEFVEADNPSNNHIGGLVGLVDSRNLFAAEDFACYATIQWPKELGHNFGGAFGYLLNEGTMDLARAFAKIETNASLDEEFSVMYEYTMGAIAGRASRSGPATVEPTYNFSQLYGYMMVGSPARPVLSLFETHYTATMVGCQGTDTLPASHGFDPAVWDVSDPTRPVLK